MACLIRSRGGCYSVKWWHQGRQYKASIGKAAPTLARLAKAVVEDTLARLKLGLLTIPADADTRTFIFTGGVQTQPAAKAAPGATLRELADAFIAGHKGKANSRVTIGTHLGHVCRLMEESGPVGEKMACQFVDQRLAEGVRPYTIRKELRKLHQALRWGRRRGLVDAAPSWNLTDIPIGHDEGREPFRTFHQIQGIIDRQRLKGGDAKRLWECLYLSSEEIDDCLNHAAKHGNRDFVHPMLAIVALTGCRRSEMLRSRPEDWDFEHGVVHVREQKRDTSRKYTTRAVDIHPTLAAIVRPRIEGRPKAAWVIGPADGTTELSPDAAHHHMKFTLASHPRWKHIPGFHTFRHSFASILACRGVDQRIIDRYMGHQTDEMRHRYQHLFPKATSEAIGRLMG